MNVELEPVVIVESRPARGGWIEIRKSGILNSGCIRLAPRGAGGLKSDNPAPPHTISRLAPRGAGGLKYNHVPITSRYLFVSPREGRVD